MSTGHARILEAEKFYQIVGGLQNFRIDNFIRMLEKEKGPNAGKILPFVRGLRFSALLIYSIRELLSHTDLEVSWGHILDDKGEYCSKECDIIIHKKGYRGRWNGSGNGNSVMDFKFIDFSNATVVISCKSYLSKSEIEVEYCAEMKNFVDKVWLFAECCGPRSGDAIKEAALQQGYENFWHLYTFNRESGDIEHNLDGWADFVEKVRALK